MKFLCKVTEIYRVESENEAAKLIEEAKTDKRFTLLKSSTEYKTKKAKGEIIEEYWLTTLVKEFTDYKDPTCSVEVSYSIEEGYFPNTVEEDE